MIESPKNFIEQFQNFIEHIAGVMKTFLTKEEADKYYLSFTAQTLNEVQKTQARTNIGAISLSDVPTALSMYPVGSIYMSVDANFNPNTAFGGTWVKIENRFLLGSGTKAVGATGGEENVTLTYNQMPPHTHGVGSISGYGTLGNGGNDRWGMFYGASGVFNFVGDYKGYPTDSSFLNDRRYMAEFNLANNRWGDTANAGLGWAHNNMPPYQVVNVWRRTA